jgi:protease-4
MVDQIFDLIKMQEDDGNLAGLILRVNSPGGSAFASEQIWEALEQFKSRTGLPFYVSMGDVAASGGYYISCGADKIFAQPTTITGSIGIFGLIPHAAQRHDRRAARQDAGLY